MALKALSYHIKTIKYLSYQVTCSNEIVCNKTLIFKSMNGTAEEFEPSEVKI
jgi:hypothetical protein